MQSPGRHRLTPTVGLPTTPPDSPRKRRNFLRESEDAEGEISIEDYIYRCDPYRTTTITEPWPYPINSVPAANDIVERVETHRNNILQILRDDGFPPNHFLRFWVSAITKPYYPHGDRPITVLRLCYRGVTNPPVRLGPTKDTIYGYLATRGIFGVHVEIVFIDKCFRPSMFSISERHPAVQAYTAAKRQIMRLIMDRLGSAWHSISLFMVGLTKEKSSPSIVILVYPFTVADWANLAIRVRGLLPTNYPASRNISVEFLPGKISAITPPPNHNGLDLSLYMRDDGVPVAGTSITVLPERGDGSLGPFVTLEYRNQTWTGALTNFHVIRPASTALPFVSLKAERSGSDAHVQDATNTSVHFFAPKDTEMTTWGLQNTIHASRKELGELQKEKADRESIGARVPGRVTSMISQNTRMITESTTKLNVVNTMPLHLGRVLLSSGKKIIDNRVADWAFIDLNQRAFDNDTRNMVNRMPCVPKNYRPYNANEKPALQTVRREGDILDEFGELQASRWYCKTGRSTQFTAGICNGVKTYCNWASGTRTRFNEDGSATSDIQDGVTEEWVITTEKIGENGTTEGVFCEEGESGSGLIDKDGRVSGLLYARSWALCGHRPDQASGLCSTMPDIRKWIERKVTQRDDQGRAIEQAVLGLPTSPESSSESSPEPESSSESASYS